MRTEDCPRCDDDGTLMLGGAAGLLTRCPYCDAWEAAGNPPEGRMGTWKACQSFRGVEMVISSAGRLLASFAEGKSDLYRLGVAVDGQVRIDTLAVEGPPWLVGAGRGRATTPAGFAETQEESW